MRKCLLFAWSPPLFGQMLMVFDSESALGPANQAQYSHPQKVYVALVYHTFGISYLNYKSLVYSTKVTRACKLKCHLWTAVLIVPPQG